MKCQKDKKLLQNALELVSCCPNVLDCVTATFNSAFDHHQLFATLVRKTLNNPVTTTISSFSTV